MSRGPEPATPELRWPEGRRFAFSIFDDTDWTTLRNGPAVYDLLDDLGLAITKSVWVHDPGPRRTTGGGTCAEPDYLRWVLDLQARGHEIGFHNATDHSSDRATTRAALDRFEELFGHAPRVGADHAANAEALYAGPARLSGVRSRAYRWGQRVVQPERPAFSGEDPGSPYFWGDLCAARIDYWRRFTFARTDLAPVGPVVHHDPSRPFVRSWFHSCHGPRLAPFLERLAPSALDSLERDGGVCIMYTHFGLDFVDERGRPRPELVRTLTALAERGGWFVPVSTLLDHVAATTGTPSLGPRARRRLEHRWIADRLRQRAPIGPKVATHDRGDG